MDSNMPLHLRHAALRAAHNAREQIASIDAIDDSTLWDMILTKLSPAILSVLCPHPGTTPANDDPNLFFNYGRDLCYLRLVFTLARNSDWHPHLFWYPHIDRCISMIPQYCKSRYYGHAFFVAGILLQITPEQTSDTSLDSVTEQQWWDVMRSAWGYSVHTDDTRYLKLLLVLVDGTKKYMQIASKSDLEQLIENVDQFIEELEGDIRQKRQLHEIGQEIQDSEQGEGVIAAAKELRTAASNMVESFGQ
ncbi:uncharacterized protein F5891DRAFT_1067642 [Suillus fuscotomentosus]|uniref:Uncharacterized protein n=1 Tax=Suillus fuscotomentosus TaxID=1912939 RepID=A0AAD4DUP1_9AGAM|nr:uncharacterized protein F5891DRAFT_1067642 [Suillus fuscotomentosus]KAG1893208.1 hypothetical protein F5891DRAFT_1067642 [Suillus fuscotomentosus]